MMINSTEVSAADLLLQDTDFPDNFVHMQHPDDYITVDAPFTEYIPHFVGHHNCLIIRICWKVGDNKFVPMSFVCDTGAPMGLYVSEKATNTLRTFGRVLEDEAGNEYTYVNNAGKTAVDPTPPGHAPGNIIGLRLLAKLGLDLREDRTFRLRNVRDYF